MNAVLEWPTVTVEPVKPPVAEVVENEVTELLPVLQTLREHSLAELNAVEQGLAKLKSEHGSTDYDISTPHGYKLATTRRHAIRLVRYEVPKVVKAKRAELNEIREAVAAEGDRIIAALKEIEDPHDKLIEAEDARREAEKAEKHRLEAERKAKHSAAIATLTSYADRCQGLSSARIAVGIHQLEAIQITDAWEEYRERAELAKASTLAMMRDCLAKTIEREEEAARLEAQRIENERVAAELAAERKRLDEAAAKVQAEADALKAAKRAEADRIAAEQKAEADRLAAYHAELQRERERIEAEKAENDRMVNPPPAVVVQPSSLPPCFVPKPGVTDADIAAAVEKSTAREEDEADTLTLIELGTLLGFELSDEFVCNTLKVKLSKSQPNRFLVTELPRIFAGLHNHLTRLENATC